MPPLGPSTSFNGKRKSSEIDDTSDYPRKKIAAQGQTSTWSMTTYWNIQWRKPQTKKNKTWEGDGFLKFQGEWCQLLDADGKPMGSGKSTLGRPLREADELHVAGRDVLIDCSSTREDWDKLSVGPFNGGYLTEPTPAASTSKLKPVASTAFRPFAPLQPSNYKPKAPNTSFKVPGQAQALATRQYPPSKSAIPVQEFFEDDDVPAPRAQQPSSVLDKTIQDSTEILWEGVWRKNSSKKHKNWDGDGMVHQKGTSLRFLSENGKKVYATDSADGSLLTEYSYGTKVWDSVLAEGSTVQFGSKEVLLGAKLPLSRLNGESRPAVIDLSDDEGPPPAPKPIARLHKFTAPTIVKQVQRQEDVKPKPKSDGPLFDPTAEGAIVMKSPTRSRQQQFNSKNRSVVPVVIDPLIATKLRPHQIEGVKFMYECVMGMRSHEGQGCILGDEMGLGKTLQTITLIWTLLKQNPYAGSGPVIGKAMIVCPVSLVENWRKEFHKWIGRDRIGVFTGDCEKAALKQFINSRNHQVLVIGYERLRGVIEELAYCHPPIGLIVCDEGHRLKTAGSKTSKMFKALRTPRRVILSGTPIQNDLGEFHAMVEFCNPNLLDDYSVFKRCFEGPILASRLPDCSPNTRAAGIVCAKQLKRLAKSFVLRREASILSNYLPPKYEYVVFVTPTELQLSMMQELLHPDRLHQFTGNTARSLALIQTLSKLCNSPLLLKYKEEANEGIQAALRLLPPGAIPSDISLSGKLQALGSILKELKATTEEKCIIVSNYTSTLNIVEAFCTKQRYTFFRLDGQTPQVRRQEYVDKFNRSSQSERFIFLLSTKAGGVGLNLIGASRLVLVDGDWNPSHDLQAMARIHRDGQKRPVFIYRLLTAGTIDEKIYQRQITKIGLSDAMMGTSAKGGKSKTDSFTNRELRDLFNIYPHVACHTHELLGCTCGARQQHSGGSNERKFVQPDSDEDEPLPIGFQPANQVDPDKQTSKETRRKREALSSLAEWTHIDCMRANATNLIQDQLLRGLVHTSADEVSFDDSALWDELDGPEQSMKDAPAGTITFLFERVTKTDI